MKKVLVVGFENYNQEMYPHTYDFLGVIKKNANLIYFGKDDRGACDRDLGLFLRSPKPLLWPFFLKKAFFKIIQKREIRKKLKKIIKEKKIDVVILIDHSALHYSSHFLSEKTKLIFWSLDYFSSDHPWMDSFLVQRLTKTNQKDINNCSLIIVQDGNRAAVLDSILKSHNVSKFYLPVALCADRFSKSEARKRQSCTLKKKNITLIQIGNISSERGSDIILEAYQKMPDNISLVFKGVISRSICSLVEKAAKKATIYSKSNTFKKMRENINKADIGIIACKEKNLNNHFFSRASGQLVEYSRLAIPIIILDIEELGEYIERHRCGVSTINSRKSNSAVQKVIKNYRYYSQYSYKVFQRYFDMGLYEKKVIARILSGNLL